MVRNIITRYSLVLLLLCLGATLNTNCADIIVGGPHIIEREQAEKQFEALLIAKLSTIPATEADGAREKEMESREESLLVVALDAYFDSAAFFCRPHVYYFQKDVGQCMEYLAVGMNGSSRLEVLRQYYLVRHTTCKLEPARFLNESYPLEGEIDICG